MSEFELLLIPVSLILGLGVALVLGGFVHAIRNRRNSRLHWLPITWGVFLLWFQVQFFSYLFELNETFVLQPGTTWTWARFGPVLLQAIFLFMGAGLILPAERAEAGSGLAEDFDEHGRLALIPFGLLFLSAIPFNVWLGGAPWVSLGNAMNVALVAILTVAFLSRTSRLQAASALAFGVVAGYALLFVWSRPGV